MPKYQYTSESGNTIEMIIGFDLSAHPDRCFINGVEVAMPEEIEEALKGAARQVADELIDEMMRGTSDGTPVGIMKDIGTKANAESKPIFRSHNYKGECR